MGYPGNYQSACSYDLNTFQRLRCWCTDEDGDYSAAESCGVDVANTKCERQHALYTDMMNVWKGDYAVPGYTQKQAQNLIRIGLGNSPGGLPAPAELHRRRQLRARTVTSCKQENSLVSCQDS
nr:hypothetical protein BaRGS_013176 [Batillaria attramentaria]